MEQPLEFTTYQLEMPLTVYSRLDRAVVALEITTAIIVVQLTGFPGLQMAPELHKPLVKILKDFTSGLQIWIPTMTDGIPLTRAMEEVMLSQMSLPNGMTPTMMDMEITHYQRIKVMPVQIRTEQAIRTDLDALTEMEMDTPTTVMYSQAIIPSGLILIQME